MARIHTIEISETQCIGDSLNPINDNYLSLDNECQRLDTNVDSISAYTKTIQPVLSASGTGLTLTGNLSATGSVTGLSEVRTNTIRSTTGTTHFVNGYPRQPGQIIECLSGPCDGSTITVGSSAYTFPNVATSFLTTASYQDITGSSIIYTPPAGATRVIYRFEYTSAYNNADSISHLKFFIDSSEVIYARFTTRASNYRQNRNVFQWPIAIGGSTDTNTGRQSTWTSAKTLKMQIRAYSASYTERIHSTLDWDGAGPTMFSMPVLTIMAVA